MYNLDLKITSVEEKKDWTTNETCYGYGLVNKAGFWKGSLTLPERLDVGDKLSIVVFVNMADEAERNARDAYDSHTSYYEDLEETC